MLEIALAQFQYCQNFINSCITETKFIHVLPKLFMHVWVLCGQSFLHWMKIKFKGYFPRYFALPRLLPILSYSGVLFLSVLASDHVLELPGLSIFFRVYINFGEVISSGRRQIIYRLGPVAWRPKAFSR